MLTSTKLAPEYRFALFSLRAAIVNSTDERTAELLLNRVQDLADQLMRGTAPLVEVPLATIQAEYEAEKIARGEPLGALVRLEEVA
jgi:hypothetical protein